MNPNTPESKASNPNATHASVTGLHSVQTETPPWLQGQLQSLPAELTPARDLWPEVARQLDRNPRQRWLPLAMAASVLVSVLSATLTWQLYQQRQTELSVATAEQLLQQLESPYSQARVSYAEQWPKVRAALDPETAVIVERNLEIIRNAHQELAKALKKRPDDPALQQLMRQTLAKELEVYQIAENASRVAI